MPRNLYIDLCVFWQTGNTEANVLLVLAGRLFTFLLAIIPYMFKDTVSRRFIFNEIISVFSKVLSPEPVDPLWLQGSVLRFYKRVIVRFYLNLLLF